MNDKVWAAFERDIPKDVQETTLEAIENAAWDGRGQHGPVYISSVDKHDAINITAEGEVHLTICGKEKEFTFVIESGNYNGTVLRGWEEAGQQEIEICEPTRWTLAPANLNASSATDLLKRWDEVLKDPKAGAIPNNYTYDNYVTGGDSTSRHWRQEAAKLGMTIVSSDEAALLRKRLVEQSKKEAKAKRERKKAVEKIDTASIVARVLADVIRDRF
jgi:hypothetical protein